METASVRFAALLRWATIVAGGSTLYYLGVGLFFGDPRTLISATLILIYTGALLVTRQVLAAGRSDTAALIVGIGLLITAIGLTIAQPQLWVSYAVAPMLAAAVLLQYSPLQRIYGALAACAISTAAIALIGELLPAASNLPDLFITVMRITSLIMTIAFVLFLLWQFRSRLEESLSQVRAANAQLSSQNTTLIETNARLQAEINTSQQLVAQVTALETPVTRLADTVLYAPVFGYLTETRAEQLRSRILEAVFTARARWIIVDIQGVPEVDTQVAGALLQLFQAVRLLGCRICICGISSEVARVITGLGLTFGEIASVRNPQEALAFVGQAG